MELWLRNIGLVSVVTVLLVLIQKAYRRLELLRVQECSYENSGVYAAAAKFAGGAAAGEVQELLAASFEFNRQEIERIVNWALPHRMEPDGGYDAFLQGVNRVLGKEVYRS
ncbi:hypothetical protein MHI24_31215 [Paenibacillus sp. FSL K6-1096]|uniref:hypothetical protein n=1 Tax=Paenibacillus sp. FSL K6-1096 TaxID=2921460 RepID=UPI0030ED8DFA